MPVHNASRSMLRSRIVTALALLIVFLASLFWLPTSAFAALMCLVVIGGSFEWGNLAGMPRWERAAFVIACAGGYAVLAAFQLTGVFPQEALTGVFVASVVFWIGCAPVWMWFGTRQRGKVLPFLLGLFVLLPCALASVVLHSRGPGVLLAALALIWIADTAAYFSGRAFGRTKLAPSISPGKTLEGAAGAMLACIAYGVVLNALSPSVAHVTGNGMALTIMALSAALCVLSIVGDLFESMLKRQANIKDSGSILPGHGGILDRIDSVTSTLPAAALAAAFLMVAK